MPDLKDVLWLLYEAPRSWRSVHYRSTGWLDDALVHRTLQAFGAGLVGEANHRPPEERRYEEEGWIAQDRLRQDRREGQYYDRRVIWTDGHMRATTGGHVQEEEVSEFPWPWIGSRWVLDPTSILRCVTLEVLFEDVLIGRPVVRIATTPRIALRRGPGMPENDGSFVLGSDRSVIAIDAERGMPLAKLDFIGETCVGDFEMTAIEFDVDFPDSTFSPRPA
jgi:hypothetical protein